MRITDNVVSYGPSSEDRKPLTYSLNYLKRIATEQVGKAPLLSLTLLDFIETLEFNDSRGILRHETEFAKRRLEYCARRYGGEKYEAGLAKVN